MNDPWVLLPISGPAVTCLRLLSQHCSTGPAVCRCGQLANSLTRKLAAPKYR
jgi:hypothetical protein